jgi:hypothetical protein
MIISFYYLPISYYYSIISSRNPDQVFFLLFLLFLNELPGLSQH